jgi:hypothetical protein
MNSDEAREILEVYRPGGADEDGPRVREALAQMQRDPELARWFAAQVRFDAAMAKGVKGLEVPADLKASLLAARSVVVRLPVSWWRPALNSWRLRVAAAAAIVLLISIGGTFSQRGPTRFADFRREIIEENWNRPDHLQFRSSNLVHVKQWLARQGGPTGFSLPSGFEHPQLHGCGLVHVGGHPVAVLCLAEGAKHLHLYVADDVQFADLPKAGVPDFEKCGVWKTASWQKGDQTYVLAGMKYPTFISTFRKFGRWTISG